MKVFFDQSTKLMSRLHLLLWWVCILLTSNTRASSVKPWGEVYELIRTNLPNSSAGEFNQSAVEQWIAKNPARVLWETNSVAHGLGGSLSSTNGSSVTGKILSGSVVCLAVEELDHKTILTLLSEWEKLSAQNKIQGVVLDLRFARGTNYAIALEIAGLFAPVETVDLRISNEQIPSPRRAPNAARILPEDPLVLLVNGSTSGAAELIPFLIGNSRSMVVIGSPTAGALGRYQNFTLSNGDRIRLLTGEIQIAGASMASGSRFIPDLETKVDVADERHWRHDPYAVSLASIQPKVSHKKAGSESLQQPKLNEAELVRRQREERDLTPGEPEDDEQIKKARAAKPPEIRDPALARALDLVKAIPVLKRVSSPGGSGVE